LQPEFEDVVVPTALDDLVTCVELDVIVLVLLEQVVSAHLIAACKKTLLVFNFNLTRKIGTPEYKMSGVHS
jgi:hypothetical protein